MGKILLSFILSVDGLGIGASCGIRGTKITKESYIAIFGITFWILEFSIFIGNALMKKIPRETAVLIGSGILIAMGIYMILEKLNENKKTKRRKRNAARITVDTIKDPVSCDMDNSGSIDIIEAVFLGAALSVDSFGAGIGIASIYEDVRLLPLMMAVFQVGFLYAGCRLGAKFKFSDKKGFPKEMISGVILIAIGIAAMGIGEIFI